MGETIWVVGGAIRRNGNVLVGLRGPQMSLPGKWEFPGGKVEAGETPQESLARELFEELGVEVGVGALIGRGSASNGRVVELDVYWCKLLTGTPVPHEHAELRWLPVEQLRSLDWADADIPIVELIVSG